MTALGALTGGLLWIGCLVVLHVAPELSAPERARLLDAQVEIVLLGSGWLVIVRTALALAESSQHRLVRRIHARHLHVVLRQTGALTVSLAALAGIVSLFSLRSNLDVAALVMRSSVFWPIAGLVPGLIQLGLPTAVLASGLVSLLCAHIGMLGANFPLGSATVSTFDPSSARWLADGTAGIASLFVSLALARSRPN